jgi:hypothetical protein
MGDDYCCGSERRNKGKDKRKNRKLFPYRKGGKWRSEDANKTPGALK